MRVARFLEDQRVTRHSRGSERPLVSVIMPTFMLRPGNLTRRAIESVLGQSFTDFEFIIIDDGSVDGLHDVLRGYQQQDPRIALVRHELNSGLPALRVDEGLLLARGTYVAYMFEDDEWLPGALASLVETMREQPEDCLVYGIVEWQVQRPDGSPESLELGRWAFNYAELRDQNRIANCGVLHSRAILERCGLYDPHVVARRWADYDLWLRLARVAPFRSCPHVVARANAGLPHSIGTIVHSDLVVARRYVETHRDHRLKPRALAEYEVDSLDWVGDPAEADRIREEYLVPFWAGRAEVLTPAERKRCIVSGAPRRLLVTKPNYSTSVDVTLGNFSRTLDGVAVTIAFLQEAALSGISPWSHDTLVLYRTIGTPSLQEARRAAAHGRTVVYLMDDNMLKFGTGDMADEFPYLRPGSPGYETLREQVASADLVVSYSPKITADCSELNPRVTELRTNIRESHISAASRCWDRPRPGRRLRYAILTGSARLRELRALWPVFREFAGRHSEAVEFHVWGVDPHQFGELPCPVFSRPFDHSYESYLGALHRAGFDIVLSPLFGDHDARRSKSAIKYLETTAAGAVGLYSECEPYRVVEHRVNGFKVRDGDWLGALEESFRLKNADRQVMWSAARAHIEGRYTTESQVLESLAAFEAADLHAALASRDAPHGRAVIAYFFHEALLGGATLHLLAHARIARRYGFRPILCVRAGGPAWTSAEGTAGGLEELAREAGLEVARCDFEASVFKRPPSAADAERAAALAAWMRERRVSLVHAVTYMADVALAAYALRIPFVNTLHAHYAPPSAVSHEPANGRPAPERLVAVVHSSSLLYARRWGEEIGAPARCIHASVAGEYFEAYAERRKRARSGVPTVLMAGTLQPRKGQLRAIHALKLLEEKGFRMRLVLAGYATLVPDYVAECRQAIASAGLGEVVEIAGFVRDPRRLLGEADYLLCASDDESMPQAILQAMASGVRVISTPVGGVPELVLDELSGVVTRGFGVEELAAGIERALTMSDGQWDRLVERAHLAAGVVCAEDAVAYRLLRLYGAAARERRAMAPLDGEAAPAAGPPPRSLRRP